MTLSDFEREVMQSFAKLEETTALQINKVVHEKA
jgi:hypothetical protein